MTSPRLSHDMWHGRDRQPSPLRCSIYSHENSARNWNYPEDVSAIMCLHSSRDSARNWNHPEDVSTTRIELHSCHVVIHEHDAEHLGSITFTIALRLKFLWLKMFSKPCFHRFQTMSIFYSWFLQKMENKHNLFSPSFVGAVVCLKLTSLRSCALVVVTVLIMYVCSVKYLTSDI